MTVSLAPEQLVELADMLAERLRGSAPAPRPATYLGPLTCEAFGKVIGRSAEYVQDHCRTGGIRHLPGKPYRILPEELHRYRVEGPLVGSAKKRRAAR